MRGDGGQAVHRCQHTGIPIGQIEMLMRFQRGTVWDQAVHRLFLYCPAAVADAGAHILIHAQHPRHAEGVAAAAHSGRLLDTQQHTAIVHPEVQRCNKAFIAPRIAAAPRRAGAACIDDHIYIGGYTVLHIVKADKFHMHGQARQCLIDVDQRMHVGFVEMPRQRPGAQAAPTVQDGYGQRQGGHGAASVQRLDGTEFIRNRGDIVHKIREIVQKMQVAAQADAVDLGAQQRTADMIPVGGSIVGGIAAGGKGRRAA